MALGNDGTPRSTVTATMKNGRFIVNGTKRYNSLVSFADVPFFTAAVEGRGFGLFVAPIRNNPLFNLGPA